MVRKHEKNLLQDFQFRQTAIVFFFSFSFSLSVFSSFFLTISVLILPYLSGTCRSTYLGGTLFPLLDVSERNFFLRWGGARAPSAPPPAYAPAGDHIKPSFGCSVVFKWFIPHIVVDTYPHQERYIKTGFTKQYLVPRTLTKPLLKLLFRISCVPFL